jgi:prophage regulatory protein
MQPRILRLPSVMDVTGLSPSSIRKMASTGDFPSPVRLGPRALGWLESDVIGWLNALTTKPVKDLQNQESFVFPE